MTKYGAKPTKVDGVTFASKKEAKRYSELNILRRLGEIRNLDLQPKFPITINGVKCFTYKADFSYFKGEDRVVEDVKGFKTPMYRLKKKCVEAQYAVKIVEI
jgi:hypothetical protein